MKRRPAIAKTLIDNSLSAFWSGIELHNKPFFSYRYEVCIILFIHSWELLLKAYIYRYHKKKGKLFNKDGTTKSFDECLGFVSNILGKEFRVSTENISALYEYRCSVIHFNIDKLDSIIFMLLHKTVILYKNFLVGKLGGGKLLGKGDSMLIAPLSIQHITSPLDVLTDRSSLDRSSNKVREFVSSLIQTTQRLEGDGIEESIFSSYTICFINENSKKNADILVKYSPDGKNINFHKKTENIVITQDSNAKKVFISYDQAIENFPLTSREMKKKLREIYSDYLGNKKFMYNDLLKELKKTDGLVYHHLTSSPRSKKKTYSQLYSNKVFDDFFDKYYTRK